LKKGKKGDTEKGGDHRRLLHGPKEVTSGKSVSLGRSRGWWLNPGGGKKTGKGGGYLFYI